MRHLALPLSLGLFVLAEGAKADDLVSMLGVWSGELTALAILGWWCWHTTTKLIPNMTKDFKEESAAYREHDTERIDAVLERARNDSRNFSEAITGLTEQCARAQRDTELRCRAVGERATGDG